MGIVQRKGLSRDSPVPKHDSWSTIDPETRLQWPIDFFRVEILQLPVQDEVIPLSSQKDSDFHAQKAKCENISVLFLTPKEERVWVLSVLDRAANHWYPVPYYRRFVRIPIE